MTASENLAESFLQKENVKITTGRIAKITELLNTLTEEQKTKLRIEICGDENTGARYGLANCRRGFCKKIGHRTYHYQLWAVWN